MRFISKFIQFVFGPLFALLTLGVLTLAGVYFYYTPKLPTSEDLKKIEIQVPLRIYTRENQLVAEYGEKRSRPIHLKDVPTHLKYAFIDIEDARFYEHQGIDFTGVARAFYSVLSTGSPSQGASTITMQLARNSFLDSTKSIDRKLKETLLAIKMEQNLSKDEILELYLNKIYLGNRAYGIGAAAETYYGKSLHDLSLAQCAMIAGLPKAPSRYNPIANPARAMIRRNYILKRMLEFGHISQAEYQTALNEPNTAAMHKTEIETNAPYLAEMVRAEIVKRFGESSAYTQGYHVYTTLDTKEQEFAAASLRKALMEYDRRHGYHGAEDRIDLDDYKTEEDLLDKLSAYSDLGGLQAALVLKSGSKEAEILLQNEKHTTLGMEDVRWARPFINSDRRGSVPQKVSDVLKAGDIIRVYQADSTKDEWKLTQLPKVSGALVSLDPVDGAIRAVMGGFDFYQSKFNRATQAMRQPGSSFKPIIYTAALAKGFTPTSIVNDAPLTIPGSNWRPENFGGHYVGPTTLQEALAKSRNLVSIRLLRSIGVNYAVDFATRFGFERKDLPPNLTLALGTGSASPLDMAEAYAAFANGGFKITPYFITRIEDSNGNVLAIDKPERACGDDVQTCKVNLTKLKKEAAQQEEELDKEEQKTQTDTTKTGEADSADASKAKTEETPVDNTSATPPDDEFVEYPAAKRIIDNRTHYQIVRMLQGVTRFGTAARAGRMLQRSDIAGKTGTTNDQKDAWFCGFTPKIVTIAWVGFDDMSKLGEGETATNVALPMWIDYMHRVLKGSPASDWEKPTNLKNVKIDADTGLLADEFSTNVITRDMAEGEVPGRNPRGFVYKSEQEVLPRNNRINPRQQPAPRRPERVEIPEQIF